MFIDSIKSWSEEDQPREKLMAKGPQALSDSELIAILLGNGTKNKSAVSLAKEILHNAENDLDRLGRKTISDFKKIKGIGDAKAVIIAAALELGRRRQHHESDIQVLINSKDIFAYIKSFLVDLDHEEFWVIALHKSQKIADKKMLFSGGYDAVVVDTKMVLKFALESNALALVVAHNHPSGNIIPSNHDVAITYKLQQACNLLDIQLVDHIIVGGNDKYYSFYDADKL